MSNDKTTKKDKQPEPAPRSQVPSDIIYNPNLPDAAKVVYAAIEGLSQKKGYCYAGNAYLGRKLGKNKWTISRIIAQLQHCGHIVAVHDKTAKNDDKRYILIITKKQLEILVKSSIPEVAAKAAEVLSKVGGGVAENDNTVLSKNAKGVAENDNTVLSKNATKSLIRERSEREAPLPDFLNDQKNKGRIYLSAIDPFSSPGFESWFEEAVLMRFPKYTTATINKTTLKDFDEIYKKFGQEIATSAVVKLRDTNPRLNGNVPGPSEVKRIAAAIKRERDIAEQRKEDIKRRKKKKENPPPEVTDEQLCAELKRYTAENNLFMIQRTRKKIQKRATERLKREKQC